MRGGRPQARSGQPDGCAERPRSTLAAVGLALAARLTERLKAEAVRRD
ncbi:hypothetical protein AB0N21_38935 [Streptomyces sp. NPDC051080]